MEFDRQKLILYSVPKRGILLIALVIFIILGLLGVMRGVPLAAGLTAVIVSLLLNQLLIYMTDHGRPILLWLAISLMFDLIITSTGLYFFGGAETAWLFFPAIIIFQIGFLFSWGLSLSFAALFTLTISSICALEYFGILPHYNVFNSPYPYWKNANYLISYMAGMFFLYFAGASFSSYCYSVLKGSEKAARAALESSEKARREIEQMNKYMVDRELKVIEMKNEVNQLLEEKGQPKKYS